eukprot:maker-scaffold_32-snap-gene-2.61-mRNA-1 protein AED:0.00 eAED:0.00 QI:61/1/1/1/1/1/2/1286/327
MMENDSRLSVLKVRIKLRKESDERKLDVYEVTEKIEEKFGCVDFMYFYTKFSAIFGFADNDKTKTLKRFLDVLSIEGRNGYVVSKMEKGSSDDLHRKVRKSVKLPENVVLSEQMIVLEKIPGLIILKEFISEIEEAAVSKELNVSLETQEQQLCLPFKPLRRRVAHFGYKFNYKLNRADEDSFHPFSSILMEIKRKIDGSVSRILGRNFLSDQATVNEYNRGEGIAQHVDTHSAFTEAIASLSLGSSGVFFFESRFEKFSIYVPRRSLFVMTGESRYEFTHQMPQRVTDLIDGRVQLRRRRVSVTFREVLRSRCPCLYPRLCDSKRN